MRTLRTPVGRVIAACFGVGLAVAACAEPPANKVEFQVVRPAKVVYLYGPGALEELRSTNPSHYARAERILAAAKELCRPGPSDVEYVKFDAKDISCEGMLLRTSNPPQRQVSFTLDDTRYIALVFVTDNPPRLVRTH